MNYIQFIGNIKIHKTLMDIVFYNKFKKSKFIKFGANIYNLVKKIEKFEMFFVLLENIVNEVMC